MNTPNTYTENIEQSQNLVSKLTQQILPGLASNMSAHMGDFVSVLLLSGKSFTGQKK